MSGFSLGVFGRGWSWFVTGLAEACLWVWRRWDRRPVLQARLAADGFDLQDAKGLSVGRVVAAPEAHQLELSRSPRHLAGCAIDVHVPGSWLFRRSLEPVSVESAPYLDGYVRHQIERITPWRAADVHYQIRHAPLAGDPGRLSLDIGVLPRKLVAKSLAALAGLRPRTIRLVAAESDGTPFRIELDRGGSAGHPRLTQAISIGTVALVLGFGSFAFWASWEASAIQADLDAQDRVIAERRAVMIAAQRRDHGSAEDEALRTLRKARSSAVDVIEALSSALPDSAYLTEISIDKDRITLSGVSTDLSDLVPALETSGRFRNVAFSAPTTRIESGDGDVFHLDLQSATPKAEITAP